ncbi:MAG: ABC transporter substrate-binding protein [Spirochaetaceae bacterium]|nr:ABC transporter substrate-binding protein [Spirochaetaceae bacterium]
MEKIRKRSLKNLYLGKPLTGAASIAKILAFTVFLGVSIPLFAAGDKEGKTADGNVTVVSTSWVAAIAYCAGAENVHILAPVDLRHPPEYELKPSDLTAAGRASLIIYAGWEMFAKKLAETAGSAGVTTLRIKVSNDPNDIKAEAKKIAEILGTTEKYETWVRGFDTFTAGIRDDIRRAYHGKRAVVNSMQTPFISWLGIDIAGEYGPAEPSPALVLELVNLKPDIVIDNYHNPSGRPVAEAAKAPYAELINFPGRDGTRTVEDVFRYNAGILLNIE